MKEGILLVVVGPENLATISRKYSMHRAIVVELVLKRAVKLVALEPYPQRYR